MRPLALAALMVLAAVPASASPTPPTECEAHLVLAAAGATDSCGTLGNPNIPGADHARQLRLTVASGAATATLTCWGSELAPITVTLDGPGTATKTLADSGNCGLVVTATAPLTTAVASNTSAYIFR